MVGICASQYMRCPFPNWKELAGGYDGEIKILAISSGETVRSFSIPVLDSTQGR